MLPQHPYRHPLTLNSVDAQGHIGAGATVPLGRRAIQLLGIILVASKGERGRFSTNQHTQCRELSLAEFLGCATRCRGAERSGTRSAFTFGHGSSIAAHVLTKAPDSPVFDSEDTVRNTEGTEWLVILRKVVSPDTQDGVHHQPRRSGSGGLRQH